MNLSAARKPLETGLLDTLRAQSAWVAQEAEHVVVHTEKIADYSRFILDKYPLITGLDTHHLVSSDKEETASYVLALDSINFGSGYFRSTGLEYLDVAGGLKRAFLRGEMNMAIKWAQATPEECTRIFGPSRSAQHDHGMREKLMLLFSRHLNVTGHIMLEQYEGKTLNLVEAAEHSAARMVDIVAEWETFRDIPAYKGRHIPILKRAQIFAADLELTGIPQFTDMDALTCFADNMVPHVLRCDGILSYNPALAKTIADGIFILPGSPEEVELRACAIHAVELMKAAALEEGRNVTSPNIDHLLWNRGYEPDIYAKPTHQTLTTCY